MPVRSRRGTANSHNRTRNPRRPSPAGPLLASPADTIDRIRHDHIALGYVDDRGRPFDVPTDEEEDASIRRMLATTNGSRAYLESFTDATGVWWVHVDGCWWHPCNVSDEDRRARNQPILSPRKMQRVERIVAHLSQFNVPAFADQPERDRKMREHLQKADEAGWSLHDTRNGDALFDLLLATLEARAMGARARGAASWPHAAPEWYRVLLAVTRWKPIGAMPHEALWLRVLAEPLPRPGELQGDHLSRKRDAEFYLRHYYTPDDSPYSASYCKNHMRTLLADTMRSMPPDAREWPDPIWARVLTLVRHWDRRVITSGEARARRCGLALAEDGDRAFVDEAIARDEQARDTMGGRGMRPVMPMGVEQPVPGMDAVMAGFDGSRSSRGAAYVPGHDLAWLDVQTLPYHGPERTLGADQRERNEQLYQEYARLGDPVLSASARAVVRNNIRVLVNDTLAAYEQSPLVPMHHRWTNALADIRAWDAPIQEAFVAERPPPLLLTSLEAITAAREQLEEESTWGYLKDGEYLQRMNELHVMYVRLTRVE